MDRTHTTEHGLADTLSAKQWKGTPTPTPLSFFALSELYFWAFCFYFPKQVSVRKVWEGHGKGSPNPRPVITPHPPSSLNAAPLPRQQAYVMGWIETAPKTAFLPVSGFQFVDYLGTIVLMLRWGTMAVGAWGSER